MESSVPCGHKARHGLCISGRLSMMREKVSANAARKHSLISLNRLVVSVPFLMIQRQGLEQYSQLSLIYLNRLVGSVLFFVTLEIQGLKQSSEMM